jgi:transcription factor SPN1
LGKRGKSTAAAAAATTTAKSKTSSSKNKQSAGDAEKKATKDTRSMKERMEALARKRAAAAAGGGGGDGNDSGQGRKKKKKDGDDEQQPPRKKRSKDGSKGGGGDGDGDDDEGKGGYESGDSYDSATFERTKDDDDFIDADDEDPDALRELYAEQHFADERPDGESSDDENAKKKKKSSSGRAGGGKGGLDKISLSDDDDDANGTNSASAALKAAVRRMQKKKKEVKKLSELEEEGVAFLKRMDEAAESDEKANKNKRPGLKKMGMMQEVTDMLSRKDMVRVLLDLDLLSVCKRWIQPLPDGTLGNITLRRRILECTIAMAGEDGINSTDLKRSGYGKVIMALFTHKSEAPEMKKMLRSAIEQWSRPIFHKSGNLRDLERVQNASGSSSVYDAGSSLAGMMKSRDGAISRPSSSGGGGIGGGGSSAVRGRTEDDLERIIASGASAARDLGNNRVRVPYSKGFQYTVRPESRRGDVSDKRNLISAKGSVASEAERREALSKRMEAKSKKTNKMANRSANISVEGRAVK